MKKMVLIDLDGVLNEYKGDYQPDYIPEIKDGAKDFLKKMAEKYTLKLFTTRSVDIASQWLKDNDLSCYFKEVTNTKEPAWVYIDDRGVTFEGDYNDLFEKVNNFEVWYKK